MYVYYRVIVDFFAKSLNFPFVFFFYPLYQIECFRIFCGIVGVGRDVEKVMRSFLLIIGVGFTWSLGGFRNGKMYAFFRFPCF